jgi:formate hydrogenlyase subunit 3/multisubunit Na+/H+ antiporter MnhD subunit
VAGHLLEGAPWAPALVLLPLGAALLAFGLPRAGRALAALSALALPALAAGLAAHVALHGPQRYRIGGWGPPLGIDWHADGLSALLCLLTAAVGGGATLYALAGGGSPTGAGRPRGRDLFWSLWLFAWAALHALFLSADAFNLYVCLELLGLAAVGLAAQAGKPEVLEAALRYLLVNFLGSFAYLLGVVLLYAGHATLDLAALARAVEPGPATAAAAALVAGGLLLKAAVFPFHVWLPPAHGNAPAPVSAVLSALVVKASFYLFLRFWLPVFGPAAAGAGGAQRVGIALGALGAAAVVWGSVLALVQERLKLLVAYSTVAQVGALFLVFPLAGPTSWGAAAWAGGVYLALSHGLAKAGMFLAAGALAASAGHDRVRDLPRALQARPVAAFAFAAAAMSLMGLPPSGGFVGKWLLLGAAVESGGWAWAAVLGGSGLLTAGYCFRVLPGAFALVPERDGPDRFPGSSAPPAPLAEWAGLGLALGALVLGLLAPWVLGLAAVGCPFPGPLSWRAGALP